MTIKNINQLISNIGSNMKFLSLSEEKKSKISSNLHQVITLGIQAMILENVKTEDAQVFKTILSSNNEEKLFAWCLLNIPDFNKKIDGVLKNIFIVFNEEVDYVNRS